MQFACTLLRLSIKSFGTQYLLPTTPHAQTHRQTADEEAEEEGKRAAKFSNHRQQTDALHCTVLHYTALYCTALY